MSGRLVRGLVRGSPQDQRLRPLAVATLLEVSLFFRRQGSVVRILLWSQAAVHVGNRDAFPAFFFPFTDTVLHQIIPQLLHAPFECEFLHDHPFRLFSGRNGQEEFLKTPSALGWLR